MKLNNVVVSYTIHPEAKTEHVRLIEAVFAQLSKESLANVDYQVMCLEDGVSFVHVSTWEAPDGSNPLAMLSSFEDFTRDISKRVTAMPKTTNATAVGSYRGRADNEST